MWFGILTPGAHPSRPTLTLDESTVLCWTPRDRRKIDGPAWAVQGGLRVTRRLLHDAGLPPAAPRCFVCRAPCDVPDAEEARARPSVLRLPPGSAPPPLDPDAREPALLAFVHLADLRPGQEDPATLEEEALVVLPGQDFTLMVALALLPESLGALRTLTAEDPHPACGRCGTVLPGSAQQRKRSEAREATGQRRRRDRSTHGRRAA